MIAGATSEGGAAVAFPVMTLVFGIAPAIARDFSFMIQSVGMTAAAFTIMYMEVLIEWKAIFYTTIGGVAGIIFGLEYCILDPPYAKMYFVVIWGAFAASLFFLNRNFGRKVYLVLDPPHLPVIWKVRSRTQEPLLTVCPAPFIACRFSRPWPNRAPPGCVKDATWWTLSTSGWGSWVAFNWKAAVLVVTGFLGGIFSSISGSGIDICSFSCLTLLFRITEKTATPTSVVLMAINTVVGFLYRNYGQGGVEEDAWGLWLVCVPSTLDHTSSHGNSPAVAASSLQSRFDPLRLLSCSLLVMLCDSSLSLSSVRVQSCASARRLGR